MSNVNLFSFFSVEKILTSDKKAQKCFLVLLDVPRHGWKIYLKVTLEGDFGKFKIIACEQKNTKSELKFEFYAFSDCANYH